MIQQCSECRDVGFVVNDDPPPWPRCKCSAGAALERAVAARIAAQEVYRSWFESSGLAYGCECMTGYLRSALQNAHAGNAFEAGRNIGAASLYANLNLDSGELLRKRGLVLCDAVHTVCLELLRERGAT